MNHSYTDREIEHFPLRARTQREIPLELVGAIAVIVFVVLPIFGFVIFLGV